MENYLTGRVSTNKAAKRAWLLGVAYIMTQTLCRNNIQNSPYLAQFIWTEITQNVAVMPLEVMTIMRAALDFPLVSKYFND